MASQETAAELRPGGGSAKAGTDADSSASAATEDFEFCILSSGGLATADDGAADMCVADEVFSNGKLLPLRLSSVVSADASALPLLLRSDSLDNGGATAAAGSSSGFSSRSDSRSASSSSSSSVSRSTSLRSASSDSVSRSQSSRSSSFYAHPSPSPRPQPRRPGTAGSSAAAAAARRSTGSPPFAWGIIRLGVVGAPEVYPLRAAAASRKPAAAARGGSRSARFEQPSAAAKEAVALEKKLALGLLGAGLVCNCSPDAVEPVGSVDAAAAAAAGTRRRRKKQAEERKKAGAKSGQSTVRKSRILAWLDDLSIAKNKMAV